MPPDPGNRRLCLPSDLPADPRLDRILTLAGWDPVRSRGGPAEWTAVWARPPEQPFEVGITPIRLGHPGRISGLRIEGGGAPDGGPARPTLDTLLATSSFDDTAVLDRARAAVESLGFWGLSTAAPAGDPVSPPAPAYVLVLDQPKVAARKNDLQELLFVAREDHPGAAIVVWDPDDGAGQIPRDDHADGVTFADGAMPVRDLMQGAISVYTVSSPLGFDAILAGHKPQIFGRPFYAGWGLTEDRGPVTRQRRTMTRAQLVAGALVQHPLWYDPHRDCLCDLSTAIAAEAALVRAEREDRRGYVASGIRLWKRTHLKTMLGGNLRFAATPIRALKRAAATGRNAATWGTPTGTPDDLIRIEDGFLRSRGLGARLVPPLSLALDDLGIYYDPSRESRLERLIAESGTLPDAEIRRSENLVARITSLGLSKYNIPGPSSENLPEGAILVVGQVEDDASIILGAGEVRTNLGLLERARAANPEARILYKPHPDVEAGLRRGRLPDPVVLNYADLIVGGADPARLLAHVGEVWTMTSLLGFEALLRGVAVTCIGAPFYAGWGLTRDLGAIPARRTARVSLSGLAHAALIGYPRYADPVTGLPCPPEVVVDRLASGSLPRPPSGLLAKLQGLRATIFPR